MSFNFVFLCLFWRFVARESGIFKTTVRLVIFSEASFRNQYGHYRCTAHQTSLWSAILETYKCMKKNVIKTNLKKLKMNPTASVD